MRVKRPLALALLLMISTASAHAQPQVELVMPQAGYYKPGETLTFLVPPEIPTEVLQRLSLEVDGIDVTSFLSREGDKALYQPPAPLAYGSHQLRLVEYLPDGSIVERALYTVEVRKNALFREADARANVDLSLSRRVDERHIDDSLAKNQGQGGVSLEGRIADGQWQAHGAMDLLYNNQLDQTADQRRIDLARGVVDASYSAVRLRAGDQTIAGSNLVLDSFARRGLSGSLRLNKFRSEVTGFTMRTDTSTGFKDWPGVNDSDNLTNGLTLTFNPLEQAPQRLRLAVTHIDAEGTSIGNGVEGFDEPVSGSASGLVADSQTWDGRVYIRAEFAHSKSDFDASATTLDEDSDNAWRLLATYQNPQEELGGKAFHWNAGMEYKRVGPQFFSLGNPSLPSDRQLNQIFGGVNWGGLSLNTQLARETDNVDDAGNIPRLRTDYITIGGNYSPITATEQSGLMRLFSQPNLAVYAQRSRRKHINIPLAFAGDRVDDDTDSLSFSLQFAPGPWSWDLSHTRTWFNDTADLQADYVTDLSELGLDLPLSEFISLSPRLQYERLDNQDEDLVTSSLLTQLGMRFSALNDRFYASLNYSMNRNQVDDDSVNTNRYTVDANASWDLVSARSNRPGLSVFTSSSYLDENRQYQIFVGLRIGWQAAY